MPSIVRRVRESLKMNQSDFAREIGRSIQSLGLYERGARIPDDVLDRLRTLAAEHHLVDLLAEIGLPKDTSIGRVFHPGERIISQAPMRQTAARRKEMHSLLDEIFDSKMPDAIDAVESNLIVFSRYVRKDLRTKRSTERSG